MSSPIPAECTVGKFTIVHSPELRFVTVTRREFFGRMAVHSEDYTHLSEAHDAQARAVAWAEENCDE